MIQVEETAHTKAGRGEAVLYFKDRAFSQRQCLLALPAWGLEPHKDERGVACCFQELES